MWRSRLWQQSCSTGCVRAPAVQSRPVYERPGYGSLLGRLRTNVRTYIRKQLELPRQEIAEIIRANLNAAKWFAVAFAFVLMTLIALVVFIITGLAALIAVIPLWLWALIVFVVMAVIAGITGFVGYRTLELRGPTRTITSMKESIRWARARLLGRSES
jgi:uncharacterized membrane protein YqjE